MSSLTTYATPADLAAISNLELLAQQVVEGFAAGLHRSPHKGFSVEFKEHRQYVVGDELRRLDWKVFGKSDRFYIREYEQETNLRCTLVLDRSGSMAYRGSTAIHSKFDYAIRLSACLGYLMLQQQDAVGVMTFDTELRSFIPPRSRPAHLSAILDILAKEKPGADTDMAEAFDSLVPKIPPRGLLVLISDCFGEINELLHSLAFLRSRRHEVLVFQIWDRDELDFPFYERARFDSLELPEQLMIDPAHLRDTYLAELGRFRKELQDKCYTNRVTLVPLVTDEPYGKGLAQYLGLRKGRRR
ncbi:MAG: DUF58 domain-containing protein [Verrucomicrobiota bacterium]|nr:DUF58 domain-containing protein [Verrucomicrobiota bacterium]